MRILLPIMISMILCSLAANALPNPSSEFCVSEGYKETAKGCQFSDGKTCNTWEFMRGKCGQKYTKCAQKGFKVTSTSKDMGGWKAQVGTCIFPDKTECELSAYSKGECKYSKAETLKVSNSQSRDLGTYLNDKRISAMNRPECKKEGETIPNMKNPPKCCPGLKMIRPNSLMLSEKALCTAKCGNFKCDKETEDKTNCPRDCKY